MEDEVIISADELHHPCHLEDDLTADYDRITSTAEAEREADQIDFTSTKNQLWKDLSWLIRETLAEGRHVHGYRAGPVFGFTE